jgi:hypothetical protein
MRVEEREALNLARCIAPRTNNESSHFIVCPTCGQAFDMRRLGDVFYHDEPDHDPMLLN